MEIDKVTFEMINSFKSLTNNIKSLFDSNILNNIDLSLSELKVLEVIEENNEVNVSKIASGLRISKSAVSQIVSKLEKKGCIYRKVDEKNKKINYLYLTDNSQNVYRDKKYKCKEIIEKVVKKLGDENILKLSELLNQLSNVIESIGKDDICA